MKNTKRECQHIWAGHVDVYEPDKEPLPGQIVICARCGLCTSYNPIPTYKDSLKKKIEGMKVTPKDPDADPVGVANMGIERYNQALQDVLRLLDE